MGVLWVEEGGEESWKKAVGKGGEGYRWGAKGEDFLLLCLLLSNRLDRFRLRALSSRSDMSSKEEGMGCWKKIQCMRKGVRTVQSNLPRPMTFPVEPLVQILSEFAPPHLLRPPGFAHLSRSSADGVGGGQRRALQLVPRLQGLELGCDCSPLHPHAPLVACGRGSQTPPHLRPAPGPPPPRLKLGRPLHDRV